MKRLGGVQAVSFDVGGTLIDPWPSVGHVYAAVAAEAGLTAYDPALLNKQFSDAWRTKLHFDYTRRAWADLVVRTFGGSTAEFGLESELFARLYDRFTEASAWSVYADVAPTLEALASRRLHLAVISNWDDRLRPLLRNLRLDRFFEVIAISVECGFHKPFTEVFHHTARALGLAPGSILHVGDSNQEDLVGAQAAGLKALLLRRDRQAAASHEIGSLAELLDRIQF